MQRRTFLKALAALPLAARFAASRSGMVRLVQWVRPARWVRPGEPGWPSPAEWAALSESVGGRLVQVQSAFAVCEPDAGSAACADVFQNLTDPFYIDQSASLTQTLGWLDAFTSQPSAYAVLAESSADVAAAVNFAREHHVRLVVKGGGHSYLGTSNAPDSLLIWTRPNMQAIELNDSFVPQGGAGLVAPEPAVSVDAGCLWIDAYNAVTTVGGQYVQGGGCTTVGVGGFTQGGGFGSFSKEFGTGAANLLEAEVVTADGAVRVVNAFQDPDLFWALKGGGGGTFGVVTRFTFRTHELPDYLGIVAASITAASDAAYQALAEEMISFYRESLFNPNWGEQIHFAGLTVSISMLFQGLTRAQAEQTWAPFFDWVTARAADYTVTGGPLFLAIPGQDFWNLAALKQIIPAVIFPDLFTPDPLPGALADYYYWTSNQGEVAAFWSSYQSTWLSQDLLDPGNQPALVDALVQGSQFGTIELHCNKGLAGGAADAIAWTADTAMNPAVLDSFALAITSDCQQYLYPGVPGHEPDPTQGQQQATLITAAMAPLKALREQPASYLNETDYFEARWQIAFWGDHYARLLQVKERYDPDGLFFVHHGVGTDT
jgi:FAD/FMN-containing dehydrogenase